MTWVGVGVGAIGSLFGASNSAKAAKKAAAAQQAASQQAQGVAKQVNDQQQALYAPGITRGNQAGDYLTNLLGFGPNSGSPDYGKYASADPGADWMKQIDPGYNFRLSQGLDALNHSMAARGFTPGGGGTSIKGITDYAQGEASQEYNNAFNRYQTIRNNTLSPLQNLVGLGANAVTGAAQGLGQFGSTKSDLITGSGNAAASGIVGSANAWNQGISGLTNAVTNGLNYNMFSNYLKNPSGTNSPRGSSYSAPNISTGPVPDQNIGLGSFSSSAPSWMPNYNLNNYIPRSGY
jgi:hypothetical protein